jgi:arabinan endo-1,5-alpha-L-arabinosidase
VRAEHTTRGTQIFVADQPLGPYRPHSDGAITPHDWMALDGTLYVENGQPWMIFCHEWVQTDDGTMNAVRLSPDLSKPMGEPIQLFRASEAPWCRPHKPGKYVTDGPSVYRLSNGKLLILWSSFSDKGYTVGIARSESGKMQGTWKQDPKPLFEGGGHCMTFRSLDGKPMLLLHAPNKTPDERAKFFDIHEEADDLRIEPVVWQQEKRLP